MTPNSEQAAALAQFMAFTQDPEKTAFCLLGYAGVGKSYLTSIMLDDVLERSSGEVILAAPTHKAANVARRMLSERGVDYEVGYDNYFHAPGTLITGTTAQLLGIGPVVVDDQSEKEQKFGMTDSGGILGRLRGIDMIVIDEVSMLSRAHLVDLYRRAQREGFKLLLVGDPGQLPPVKAQAIDFEQMTNKAVLQKIMRQAGDSAIPHLGAAIREGRDWASVVGAGIRRERNIGASFIHDLTGAPALDEREQDVFISYLNRTVNSVQEAACMKVYGHGMGDFDTGEVVISSTNLMDRRKKALVTNGDRLRVVEFGEPGQWGTLCRVERIRPDGSLVRFDSEYLPEELRAGGSTFALEVKARLKAAQDAQAKWASEGKVRGPIDDARKTAWRRFFELKDQTILSFAHPFAITCHKSQGSTYRRAYVNASEIAARPEAKAALYVAVTRPSSELVIG